MERYMQTVRTACKADGVHMMVSIYMEVEMFALASKLAGNAYSGGGWRDMELAPGVFITYPTNVKAEPGENGKFRVGGLENGNFEYTDERTLGAIVTACVLNWKIAQLFSKGQNCEELAELWFKINNAIYGEDSGIDASAYRSITD